MCERILAVLLAAAVLALPGCGNTTTPAAKADKVGRDATPEKTAEVKIDVVKFDELQKALAAQKGKIVVMDVWATWCVPCKQEFPHLVELHQKHAKDGVVAVSVSLDEPAKRDAALAFLKSKNAAFPNYLLDEGDRGWDRDMLDLKGIPAVFVYGPDGKLARKFTNDDPDNQFTYADVEKLVKELQTRK